MPRFFNIAGPCKPDMHYMLSPEDRLPNIRELIDSEAYFVVHAPRQVGKTTCFRELAKTLNQEGKYAAVHLSCESGQAMGNNAGAVENILLSILKSMAEEYLKPTLRPDTRATLAKPEAIPGDRLRLVLADWAAHCPRPVVLFLDEIDALLDESLISVLRQLRSGYPARPNGFPQCIALIGLRDVRDYKVRTGVRHDGASLGTSSPFNVKVESMSIRDFSEAEVIALLGQHEQETGQRFESGVKEEVFRLTHGQPWLCNALARELTDKLCRDRAVPLTHSLLERAKENLIERRDTHLDSLIEKLREERVQRVIEPILAGELLQVDLLNDDIAYVLDLGLIKRGEAGLTPANPIYREVMPRALALVVQETIPVVAARYVGDDGGLDFGLVLGEFLDFWREHGEFLLRGQPYPEAAAQLILMAYLQRIVNGGGFIDREYAVGSGRIDLLIRWPYQGGLQREAIELKVWKDKKPDPLTKGLIQLSSYLERLSLDCGTLILFDRRKNAAELPERASLSTMTHQGREITVLRG